MRKVLLSLALIAVLALPAAAQKKEQERVENSGTAMSEILNAPDCSSEARRRALFCFDE